MLAQGDENNLPKASKRSMQSASSVLALFQDTDAKYYLETKKNRFGRNKVKIEVEPDFQKYKITEGSEAIGREPAVKKASREVYR